MTLLGSVKIDQVELDDHLDKSFKPGLYVQTKAFLDRDNHLFCTLDEQIQHCAIYDEMVGSNQMVSVESQVAIEK